MVAGFFGSRQTGDQRGDGSGKDQLYLNLDRSGGDAHVRRG